MIGGMVMSQKDNFVFLASWYDIIAAYDKDNPGMAGELSKQIIYYGVTGELTTTDPIITSLINSMCAVIIDKSKRRYANCRENGAQGGRPEKFTKEDVRKLRDAGLTKQEIADNLLCSVRSVERKLAELREEDDEI
jgi:hypothetical protein